MRPGPAQTPSAVRAVVRMTTSGRAAVRATALDRAAVRMTTPGRAAVRATALVPLLAVAVLWIGLAPLAHAARTMYLRELGRLRYLHGNESTLYERGSASGTFSGSLVAQLTISAEHVTATFTIYPRGGSITGRASARFIVRGHTGYYGGTLKIVRGTGAYRHAQGSSVGISGTIDRYSFALMVKANGWIKY